MKVRLLASLCLGLVLVGQTAVGAPRSWPHSTPSVPRSFSLSWVRMQGAESCMTTQNLAKAVEARLRNPAFVSATDADLSVEGRFERVGRVWRASFTTTDATGQTTPTHRDIQSDAETCDELAESVVMAVSLIVEPIDVAEPLAELPLPTAAPTAALPSSQATAATSQPATQEPDFTLDTPGAVGSPRVEPAPQRWLAARGPAWSAHIGAAGLVGALPKPALGLVGALALDWATLPGFRLTAGYFQPRRTTSTPAGSVDIAAAYAAAAACWAALDGPVFAAKACGGARAGAYLAASTGYGRATSARALLFDAVLDLPLRLSISRSWHVGLTAGLGLPLSRPRFVIEGLSKTGQTQVFRPALLEAALELGVGWHLDPMAADPVSARRGDLL